MTLLITSDRRNNESNTRAACPLHQPPHQTPPQYHWLSSSSEPHYHLHTSPPLPCHTTPPSPSFCRNLSWCVCEWSHKIKALLINVSHKIDFLRVSTQFLLTKPKNTTHKHTPILSKRTKENEKQRGETGNDRKDIRISEKQTIMV